MNEQKLTRKRFKIRKEFENKSYVLTLFKKWNPKDGAQVSED